MENYSYLGLFDGLIDFWEASLRLVEIGELGFQILWHQKFAIDIIPDDDSV